MQRSAPRSPLRQIRPTSARAPHSPIPQPTRPVRAAWGAPASWWTSNRWFPAPGAWGAPASWVSSPALPAFASTGWKCITTPARRCRLTDAQARRAIWPSGMWSSCKRAWRAARCRPVASVLSTPCRGRSRASTPPRVKFKSWARPYAPTAPSAQTSQAFASAPRRRSAATAPKMVTSSPPVSTPEPVLGPACWAG